MKLNLKFSQNEKKLDAFFGENKSTFDTGFGEMQIVHNGQNGATFTPNVSEDGILSWTNDRELPNPEPVNIKGKDGKDGKDGVDGRDGMDGKDGYTPIKGVDYFDGKDGIDGQNGNDGKDGVDGYTPIKGEDYFTAEEVQEIAEQAAKMVDIPEGGVTSWNDLTDKPFGSEFEYTELASTLGVVDAYDRESLMASFQATLDFAPISGKLYKLVATHGVQTIEAVQTCSIVDISAMNYYTANIGLIANATAPIAMGQATKDGAWNVQFIATTEVGAEWTITVYEHSEIITPLDGKYLPDGIPFVASASVGQGIAVKAVDGNNKPIEFEAVNLVKSYNDLTDAPVGERITTIIGEQTVMATVSNYVNLGVYNLTGCNVVCFDGVEYEVSRIPNGMESLYGNPALRSAMYASNGMPFVLVCIEISNTVSLRVSELGEHTVSAHKRELVFLSEKFLPDSVVLESELEGKGYQTEEQVKTLIDEVSGAISWNDLKDRPFGDTFDFTEVASATLTVENYDEVQAECRCSGSLNFTAIHGREYKLEATDGIQTITGRGTCKIIDMPTASIYSVDITPDNGLIRIYTPSKGTSVPWYVYFKAKSEVGTEWTIRIYEAVDAIIALDEKYLPESVVLESELTEKGYQTEAQVTTIVNNALADIPEGGGGVTSWNDLTDKPDFAPIATSGSWNDLEDKPFGEVEVWSELWAENEYDSSDYTNLPAPLVAFEEGKYRYILDGIVYETSVAYRHFSMYTYLIGGNPSIVNQNFADNGQPLAFYLFNENYFLKFAPNTIGNKSFSAEKATGIVSEPIDEKYLPDTIARVEDILTEEDVSTLINSALGVIENGTY